MKSSRKLPFLLASAIIAVSACTDKKATASIEESITTTLQPRTTIVGSNVPDSISVRVKCKDLVLDLLSDSFIEVETSTVRVSDTAGVKGYVFTDSDTYNRALTGQFPNEVVNTYGIRVIDTDRVSPNNAAVGWIFEYIPLTNLNEIALFVNGFHVPDMGDDLSTLTKFQGRTLSVTMLNGKMLFDDGLDQMTLDFAEVNPIAKIIDFDALYKSMQGTTPAISIPSLGCSFKVQTIAVSN